MELTQSPATGHTAHPRPHVVQTHKRKDPDAFYRTHRTHATLSAFLQHKGVMKTSCLLFPSTFDPYLRAVDYTGVYQNCKLLLSYLLLNSLIQNPSHAALWCVSHTTFYICKCHSKIWTHKFPKGSGKHT